MIKIWITNACHQRCAFMQRTIDSFKPAVAQNPKLGADFAFVNTGQEADLILFVYSYTYSAYTPELEASIGSKPVVLIDYSEGRWDRMEDRCILKSPASMVCSYHTDADPKLLDYLSQCRVVLHFKRELTKQNAQRYCDLIPLDFIGIFDLSKPAARYDDFVARPYALHSIYGPSHPARYEWHAYLLNRFCLHYRKVRLAHPFAIQTNHWQQTVEKEKNVILTELISPEHKYPRAQIDAAIGQSRLVTSFNGMGTKCYRDAECWDTVMFRQPTGMVWRYPWVDGENCVMMVPDGLFIDCEATYRKMENILGWPKLLYDLYLAGRENMARYHYSNYVPPMLEKIKEAL